MQELTLPASSVMASSTMIGPAPTSQQLKGTQIPNAVPKSFELTGGMPPGISSTQAPPVVQSKSIQLSILRARNETAEQLSKLPSSKTAASTSVIPCGLSFVRLTTRCCLHAATGGTLSMTVMSNEH